LPYCRANNRLSPGRTPNRPEPAPPPRVVASLAALAAELGPPRRDLQDHVRCEGGGVSCGQFIAL